MAITMFGIPNCDTIKKAKKWLEANELDYSFHNYRKDGINEEMVRAFCEQLGWEQVINKRGTTYRQLTQEQKDGLNEENVIALLVEHSAMIKRPIIDVDGKQYVGFKAEQYQQVFGA
ncbi:ArsC family reductase [Vibrio sp. SCSIO 43140]|uniref:ArsC family reductase n=1 Tax=Vibrio sp. SCSIO 43140 TaxID=2819100 RepID=UPI002075FDF9|nr:ArsC family reductase [Vibrio sp. SCSIO 43140]USD59784.1 ArsC family reductase [Vibrio sp. SCSIO 43140]